MAKAKKLPSGRWRVNQYVGKDQNGKRIYKSFTADTKKEAEYYAAEYNLKRKERPADKTVDDAVQDYIDSKDKTLSESTIRGYYIIKNNALEEIKNLKLQDINEIILQKWMNANAAKYSAKSIRNQFGLITAVLRQNKIVLDTDSILLKPKQKRNILVPNEEEMHKILKIVEGTNVELPVTIALTLGLRQSEIAGLHWDDYDGEHLNIHRAAVPDKNNKLVEKQTNKSYAGKRILDVPDILKERLDRAERKSNRISPSSPSTVLRIFQKLCVKNGLPKFTMHAQRHSNASLMLKQGIPNKYAMERLGQATEHMLRDVYQHTFENEQKKISKDINNLFNKINSSDDDKDND